MNIFLIFLLNCRENKKDEQRKKKEKLTFRALALRPSEWRGANARNVSFRNSLQWPI